MKKINPKTGKHYVRGELSSCGTKRFWAYKTGHINKDGFFSINWTKIEEFDHKIYKTKSTQARINKKNKNAKYPKRLNPKTCKPFQIGDKREDGFYFIAYNSNGKTTGEFHGEQWAAPEVYLKYRIGLTLSKIKTRAEKKEIPFDINQDYLYEIFPTDGVCPILGTKMLFGGDRENSPSVDRLVPEKGYVKGNVSWVSKLANVVKSDLTALELRRIADWIEGQPIWNKHNP